MQHNREPQSLGPPPTRVVRLTQLASLCGRQLRRALAEQTSPLGLNETQFLILWTCAEGPPEGIAQHELAESIGVSAARLSTLVEQLRQRGSLACQRSDHDRRRQCWCLTAGGRELLKIALEKLSTLTDRLDLTLPQEDQQLAEQLLRRLTTASLTTPPLRVFDSPS